MNKIFKLSRALAVARKEVMHILRDPFTLGLSIGMPLVFVAFFGFAIDFDFKGINLSVFDFDNSRQSRELISVFSSSSYFVPKSGINPGNPIAEVESERSFVAMIIKPGFAKRVLSGEGDRIQVLMDGTDNRKAGVASSYIAGVHKAAAERLTGKKYQLPIEYESRFLYNPELNTKWFIVPGLIVIIVGLLSVLMTALTIAREWENGSMELLLSTPVTPLEIVIGKIMPYVALVFMGIILVYIMARVVFGVPFLGSNLLFWSACLIYVVTSLAEGLLISVVTRQQQKATQFSFIIGLLPSLILSGFIFPVENMPFFFRYFTMILPPRWFIEIVRSIFLKGSGIAALAVPFTVLIFMMLLLIIAAVKKSKKDVEP